jgi:hypothetical protein
MVFTPAPSDSLRQFTLGGAVRQLAVESAVLKGGKEGI